MLLAFIKFLHAKGHQVPKMFNSFYNVINVKKLMLINSFLLYQGVYYNMHGFYTSVLKTANIVPIIVSVYILSISTMIYVKLHTYIPFVDSWMFYTNT